MIKVRHAILIPRANSLKPAELKPLYGTTRRSVLMTAVLDQLERCPKDVADALRIVAHDR